MYVVLSVRTLRSSDSARKSTTIFTATIIFCFVISLSPVPTPRPRPCHYSVCSECISSVSIDYLASVMWLYLETAFSPALATAKRPAAEQCTGELVPAAAGTCTVCTSASKSSIRRFVITEKAPTRAFSWLKAATTAFTC